MFDFQIGIVTPYEGQRAYVVSQMLRAGSLRPKLYEDIEVISAPNTIFFQIWDDPRNFIARIYFSKLCRWRQLTHFRVVKRTLWSYRVCVRTTIRALVSWMIHAVWMWPWPEVYVFSHIAWNNDCAGPLKYYRRWYTVSIFFILSIFLVSQQNMVLWFLAIQRFGFLTISIVFSVPC